LIGKPAPDHPKSHFVPRRNPIKIHTWESPNLDYNIVEYLKKLKAIISVMDICRIPQQKDFLLQDLKSIENPMKSTDQGRDLTPAYLGNKQIVNACCEDKKGKPFVPPFILMFEVLKRKLHNFLVDSATSSNVMPLFI
jgi:hypothetical protein